MKCSLIVLYTGFAEDQLTPPLIIQPIEPKETAVETFVDLSKDLVDLFLAEDQIKECCQHSESQDFSFCSKCGRNLRYSLRYESCHFTSWCRRQFFDTVLQVPQELLEKWNPFVGPEGMLDVPREEIMVVNGYGFMYMLNALRLNPELVTNKYFSEMLEELDFSLLIDSKEKFEETINSFLLTPKEEGDTIETAQE